MQGVVQKGGFCYVVHSNWRMLGLGLGSFMRKMSYQARSCPEVA